MTEPFYPQPVPYPADRRRPWLIPVIVVGAIVVLGLVIAAAAVLVNSVLGRGPAQPLVEGDATSPVAVEPLVCEGQCFPESMVEQTVSGAVSFGMLGVPDTTIPAGTYEPATVGELYRGDSTSWRSYNGTPDECFFAPSSAPYAPSLDDTLLESTDAVHWMGTHEDMALRNAVDQAVRVFPDSASAQAYLAELAGSIADCSGVEIGPPQDRYFAQITAAPALDVPDAVAAVGWVRTGDPGPRWRAYVVDLLIGNLVVRDRLLTDGSITEQEFRKFVEQHAEELSQLEPLS